MASCYLKEEDKKPIKLLFEDEARFGRINNVRRCWTPAGCRAIVTQQIVREYIYAYTTVCPSTGETFSIISPVNNTEAMNIFLAMTAEQYPGYRIIMVLDGAGWHTSKQLKLPPNIRLLFLPPYSPELNPTEHIWDYIREQKHFNNYTFKSLDEVENQLVKALNEISKEQDIIKSLCDFHWLHCTS